MYLCCYDLNDKCLSIVAYLHFMTSLTDDPSSYCIEKYKLFKFTENNQSGKMNFPRSLIFDREIFERKRTLSNVSSVCALSVFGDHDVNSQEYAEYYKVGTRHLNLSDH